MAEKKQGDYEKPESQKMGGDELEDVSGGAGTGTQERCDMGAAASYSCTIGNGVTGDAYIGQDCKTGAHPDKGCVTGAEPKT